MNKATYLVFETGGTKLVVGVAGEDRKLIETKILYRERGDLAKQSLNRLIEAGQELRKRYERQGALFQAIGFGFGGTVRRSTQKPHICLHESGWEGFPVVQIVERSFDLPVSIENDCKLAALAEAHFGAGKGFSTVFYVTVGTGVGGGIVCNGRIQSFSDIGEAEVGHIVVVPEGPMCPCGSRGCVEAVCSGPGISRLAGWVADRDPISWSKSCLKEEWDSAAKIPSKVLMNVWKTGDHFATTVIDRVVGYLAQVLASSINLLSPEVVIVGGGVGTGNCVFLKEISERVSPQVVPYFRDRYCIVKSQLGDGVVSQGAAILAAQTLR